MAKVIRNVLMRLMQRTCRLLLYPCTRVRSLALQSEVYNACLRMVVRNSQAYASACAGGHAQFQRPATAFITRWKKVSEAIRETGSRHLLDVGCAEGYMIRMASQECGNFAVGLEMDWQRIRVACAERELHREHLHGIVPMVVNSESLASLPRFDIVICFSVLHHVIRHQGIDEARLFLQSLARITGKRFLFDMGSPDETANDPEWGRVLAFLKPDLVGNISELLESAGFTNVRHVADTPGYVSTCVRPLFICEPMQKNESTSMGDNE